MVTSSMAFDALFIVSWVGGLRNPFVFVQAVQTPCPTLRVRVVGGMDTLPEEYLAEGLTKEGGGRRDGRPVLRTSNKK